MVEAWRELVANDKPHYVWKAVAEWHKQVRIPCNAARDDLPPLARLLACIPRGGL